MPPPPVFVPPLPLSDNTGDASRDPSQLIAEVRGTGDESRFGLKITSRATSLNYTEEKL